MANGTALRAFALKTTKCLGMIFGQGQGPKDDSGGQFARTLTGALLRVDECLKTHIEAPQSTTAVDSLISLLTELEEFFKRPDTTSTAPPGRQPGGVRPGPEKVFPELNKLLQLYKKPNRMGETINKPGQDKTRKAIPFARQKRLLGILNKFCQVPGSSKSKIKVDVRELGVDQNDDHNGWARSLYNVLHACCACNVNADTRITATLRLCIEGDSNTNMATFNVLFGLHPHEEISQSGWRITTISASSTPHEELQELEMLDRQSFCPTICNGGSLYSLRLLLTDTRLARATGGDASRWIRSQDTPITLRAVLGLAGPQKRIDQKPRLLLQFLLAKALWQFYDTDWMRTPWTVDDVLFFAEHRDVGHGAFLDEPFIQASFEPSTSATETGGASSKKDQTLAIRAFGVMMMELELGISIKDEVARIPECREAGNDDEFTKQAYAAEKLFEDKKHMDNVPNQIRKAIETCLKPPMFRERSWMRNRIDGDIVTPIRIMLEGMYDAPHTISLRGPIASAQGSRLPPRVATQPMPQAAIPAPKPQSSPKAAMSKQWFGDLGKLNGVLQSPHPLPEDKRVRIAILDTGINPSCRYSRYLAGYKDFVDKDLTQRTDGTGHGTRAAELVFKVFENAEVYLGRVFRKSTEDENTKDLMAEGIRWAHQDCKADIITMASGFDTAHPGMKQAILKASSEGVLVFASASNYGNMRRVKFPARMKHHVFGIYSTNGRGKIADESASINPPEQPGAANFAILGEGISLQDLETEPEETLLTGTSYATSIAAALAGQLLDFSRQDKPPPRAEIRRVEELRTFAGMEAVLLRLSQSSQPSGGGYNCIVPFRLIEDCAEEERQVQRDRVCQAISVALETI